MIRRLPQYHLPELRGRRRFSQIKKTLTLNPSLIRIFITRKGPEVHAKGCR